MSDPQSDGEDVGSAEDARAPAVESSSSESRIVVHCTGRTAVGQVREHNEDNLVIANLGSGQIRPRDQVCEDDVGPRGLVFAVCDGMGGAAAGEVASQMAVDILVEAMRRGGPPKNRDALARRLVSAVEEAGRRIFDAAQKERSRRGMGTTSTVAVLIDKVMFLAEVGDSRAYLLRRGQLKQLTKDQSLVNQLIEAGHLTEDEAEAFEHSNIILQALGTSETVQVDLTFVELRRGDRLMMCSDGLSGLVATDTLRATLDEVKDPAECTAKLIELAEAAGGHDNISVVVADFDGEGLSEPTETDSFGYVQYPLPLGDGESSAFVDEDTTDAGERSSRSSGQPTDAPGMQAAGVDEQDRGESLLPRTPEDNDPRANLLWVLGGVAALVIATVVWFALEPEASNNDNESNQEAAASNEASENTARAAKPAATQAPVEPDEVEVNVHTDVAHATLLVNGEARGDLSSQESRSLKLHPGAYRFEAQSSGNPVAVAVVTVRGDMPMDVFLELPKGASEAPEPTAAAPSEKEKKPEAKPQSDETAKPSSEAQAEVPKSAPKPQRAAAKKPSTEKPAVIAASEHEAAPVAAPTPAAAPTAPAAAPSAPAAAPHPKPKAPKSAELPNSAEASTQKPAPAPAAAPAAPKTAIPENPF